MNRLAWLILIAWICIGVLFYLRVPVVRDMKVNWPESKSSPVSSVNQTGGVTANQVVGCTQKEADDILNGVVAEIIKHKTVTFVQNGTKYVYKKEIQ